MYGTMIRMKLPTPIFNKFNKYTLNRFTSSDLINALICGALALVCVVLTASSGLENIGVLVYTFSITSFVLVYSKLYGWPSGWLATIAFIGLSYSPDTLSIAFGLSAISWIHYLAFINRRTLLKRDFALLLLLGIILQFILKDFVFLFYFLVALPAIMFGLIRKKKVNTTLIDYGVTCGIISVGYALMALVFNFQENQDFEIDPKISSSMFTFSLITMGIIGSIVLVTYYLRVQKSIQKKPNFSLGIVATCLLAIIADNLTVLELGNKSSHNLARIISIILVAIMWGYIIRIGLAYLSFYKKKRLLQKTESNY